jgi:two-component system nitrate/nitrite response regulator NarL
VNNSVIIATNASILADLLGVKLRDNGLRVFTASTDAELTDKIKTVYPRFVFIENCFHGNGTDVFIQKITRQNRNLNIAVWAACELKPSVAARYIVAGAESFFSLRDTDKNIDEILFRITSGKPFCPCDVDEVLNSDIAYPVIGEGLTKREIEIVKLTVSGKTNEEIGKIISVSLASVKFHKSNIYRKCGGKNIADIMRYGIIHGVITKEDFE